jgi:hypothetical protein
MIIELLYVFQFIGSPWLGCSQCQMKIGKSMHTKKAVSWIYSILCSIVYCIYRQNLSFLFCLASQYFFWEKNPFYTAAILTSVIRSVLFCNYVQLVLNLSWVSSTYLSFSDRVYSKFCQTLFEFSRNVYESLCN